jgi:hypothetical protein
VIGRLGGSEYLRGVSVGMLMTLPWAAVLMIWRAYGQLDEFGRQRQTQAAAVAFVVVMLLAMTYFPLQVAASWPALPLWVLWVVGVTTWGAVLVAGELRDPPLGT